MEFRFHVSHDTILERIIMEDKIGTFYLSMRDIKMIISIVWQYRYNANECLVRIINFMSAIHVPHAVTMGTLQYYEQNSIATAKKFSGDTVEIRYIIGE